MVGKPKPRAPERSAAAPTLFEFGKANVLTERGGQAERAVIGGIMLSGLPALERAEAAGLFAEHFGVPQCEAVFLAMLRLRDRGADIEIIGIEEQLRRTGALELVGGIEGLARFDRHATAQAIESHVQIVRESATARALAHACRSTYEVLVEPDMGGRTIDELASRFKAEVDHIAASGGLRAKLRTASEVSEAALREWDDTNEGRVSLASLGFGMLDEVVVPTRGALVGIVANSGHGKTSFFASVALALQFDLSSDDPYPPMLEDPTPVLIGSAEMTGVQVQNRMASGLARLEGRVITRPIGERPVTRERYVRALNQLSDSRIEYIDDTDAVFFDRLVAAIRAFADKHRDSARVPVVFIDYLQLLVIKGDFDKGVDKYDHALRTLTMLAKDLGIVIVLLMQPVKSREPRLSIKDIREAGTAENHCKIILGIYRPWMARPQEERTKLEAEWHRLVHEYNAAGQRGARLPLEMEQRLERLTAEISEAYIDALKCRDGNMGGVIKFWFEGRFTSFREARPEP